MYEVLLGRQARKDLRRLDQAIRQRVLGGLKGLGAEPRPVGCRMLAGSESDYRLRIGDYRVLYEIDDGKRQVRVNRIRHRRDAYRLFIL
jgi:mRNA interferase RelE/StbE